MNLSKHVEKWKPNHHSYGISSTFLKSADLRKMLPQDIDYCYESDQDTCKIDEVRRIRNLQSERTDGVSVFIISCTHITHEAQNALLKILEEPSSHTYFYLIYPQIEQLLITLQSRLEVLEYTQIQSEDGIIEPSAFIAMSLDERFSYIKEITDKKHEPLLQKKDVLHLCYHLEQHFSSTKNYQGLKTVYEARTMLLSSSASLKMILDMVAVYCS